MKYNKEYIRSMTENDTTTYYPEYGSSQSPFYEFKFTGVRFSDVKRATMKEIGNISHKKKYKKYLFQGAVIPPIGKKGKLIGLTIPAQIANKFDLSIQNTYHWLLGFDSTIYHKTLFLLPHKTQRNEKLNIEFPIIKTRKYNKEKNCKIFRDLYIWPEKIAVCTDGHYPNRLFAKIPDIFLRLYGVSKRIAEEQNLETNRPVYLLYYDPFGNLLYRIVNYSEDLKHDKHFLDSFGK